MSVCLVIGNPKPQSRTLELGQTLITALVPAVEDNIVVDLGAVTPDAYSGLADEILNRVTDLQLLVVASPVYKASYTGVLKNFLDYFGQGSLEGTPTIPLMTGADATHTLTPRFTLSPLLEELGATCLRSTYFDMRQFDNIESRIAEIAQTYRLDLRKISQLIDSIPV